MGGMAGQLALGRPFHAQPEAGKRRRFMNENHDFIMDFRFYKSINL
jgi:hypothetical protein